MIIKIWRDNSSDQQRRNKRMSADVSCMRDQRFCLLAFIKYPSPVVNEHQEYNKERPANKVNHRFIFEEIVKLRVVEINSASKRRI